MTTPEIIDLMSDTVTRPTPAMRQAMATCEVGDDVFDSDPTVKELEKLTAEMTGTEASLWCPTGTMANQVAIAVHTKPGQEVIAGTASHIVNYELGGVAWNSLCQLRQIPDDNGRPDPATVIDNFNTETMHTPGTGLVCLENTHNRRGGRLLPMEILETISGAARERGIRVHLDGARIWNASVASGIPVPEYTRHVDSMMFCLSKGLASPAGSMLCGEKDFIALARRMRKRFGGGLRQVGVLAACGLVSLREMIERLSEDHENAQALGTAMAEAGVLSVDPSTIETNILIFTPPESSTWNAFQFAETAKDEGVLVTYMGERHIRMVTHNDYNSEWIDETVKRVKCAVNRLEKG